jgi:broad specificity phosphatase PhoE
LSSPKRRCVETVEPLAKATRTAVEVSDLLDEQSENDKAFLRRLEKFVVWWTQEPAPLIVACSHGDWIPLCLQRLTGVSTDLKKGGWAEIGDDNGRISLRWLLQELP